MDKNETIVVLGAGRSGTSLVMQILQALGANISKDTVSSRYHNPMGAMEDVEVADVFDKILLPACNMSRTLPFPGSAQYINSSELNRGLKKLSVIFETRVKEFSGGEPWAVKDPVFSNFLEKLFPVFNALQIVPRFVLCVRNPKSVIESRRINFNNTDELSVLAWLTNNVNAIAATGGDCHIVHYEDFFSDKKKTIISDLCRFSGLRVNCVDDAISIPDYKLNRRSLGGGDFQISQVASRLYGALLKCRSDDFDKSSLLETVNECQGDISAFQGWLDYAYEAQRVSSRLKVAEKKIQELSNKLAERSPTHLASLNFASKELSESILEFERLMKVS